MNTNIPDDSYYIVSNFPNGVLLAFPLSVLRGIYLKYVVVSGDLNLTDIARKVANEPDETLLRFAHEVPFKAVADYQINLSGAEVVSPEDWPAATKIVVEKASLEEYKARQAKLTKKSA